jgi:ABC-2 type transport system permease protein
MLLFGAIFSGDTAPNYPIGVIDNDGTPISQAFVDEALAEVPVLEVATYEDAASAMEDLKLGNTSAYIIIPHGFGEQISRSWQDEEANITLEITYDESDFMATGQIISTINAATRSFAHIEVPITINANPIHIETEITYIDFIAPGIIIFGLLILIPTSARIIVHDKEKGFLSRLLTTPLRPVEFILGYSLCLVVIAIAQIIIFILVGWLLGMDIVGSVGLAFLIFFLTGLCSIGIGMVVASLSKSENQAEPLCWIFAMPLAILSGCWFSVEMLPSYLRNVAYAFPYAHAIDASKAVITRGVGMEVVSNDVLFLAGWTAVIFAIGVILFRRSMRS